MKTVIILGTSKKDRFNDNVISHLQRASGWDLIDLNNYNFSYYDYDHQNAGDDYIPLMQKLLASYDTLVFATPVYWYSMSGIMKVFFDRFTDLLTIEKDLGRKLRGKKMAAISCSVGNNLGEHFWLPFSETASYLGMKYIGDVHTIMSKNGMPPEEMSKIQTFIEKVNNGTDS